MSRVLQNILVTGGCGFIGSNFIRHTLSQNNFTGKIINLDALTYAGNPENLEDYQNDPRYVFVQGSIEDGQLLESLFDTYDIDTVVNFAAESHVDRSIHGPAQFMHTNVMGTFMLLETARNYWAERNDTLFLHISTDEVYGSLGSTGYFTEATAYDPRSPYSASKASSDHLVRSYYHTYGLPVTITNCSNNYGPYQFPEKLIPLMILNMLENKHLPVYGDGKNVRDWLYVGDHVQAIWTVLEQGVLGECYNVGGDNEWSNIGLIETLCDVVAQETERKSSELKNLIQFVKDRPGHDRRYAIDCEKIKQDLGWKQTASFTEGVQQTVRWYLNNMDWVKRVQSGEYLNWLRLNYQNR